MTTQVRYDRPCHVRALGRNRYVTTTGIDILATGDELILYPLNSRGESSNSCCIPVRMTAAPAVADALVAAAAPTLHDQLGYWPPNQLRQALARIIAAYDADEAPSYDDALEAAIVAARELLP